MLKYVLFILYVSVSDVRCFLPNCIRENQYKFYSFPVEGCSDYLKDLCTPVESGRFEVIGQPKIVKIKMTSVLPTCAFYGIDSLQHIYGVKSNIKVLAKGSFVNLPNLKSIILSYNQITEIRELIFKNVSTEKLDLSWNNIFSVDPDAFKEVHNLKELDLSRNSLLTVPVNHLSRSISTLNLAYNQLTRIAINSLKFTNLTSVDLSNNKIENIAISFFYPIEMFDLTNNQLYDIDYVEITSVNRFRIGLNNFRRTPQYLENINANNIGIYPNPWSCEALPDLWRSITSLKYNIETTGTASDTMEICTNITTVSVQRGGPKSCTSDHQCPTSKTCKVGQCLDPCSYFCHRSSVCKTKNHQFTCTCPKGTKSDPMDLTGSCKKVECYVGSHCSRDKVCIQNRCAKIAATSTTPRPSTTTETNIPESEDIKPWWFEDIPSESPGGLMKQLPPVPHYAPIPLIPVPLD
ncbi:hypothetical protein GWI33_021815 [Rhynchophorus ferrugineus]|uniref:Uncharacterized protein n=1 Tax=Rhynchophorus ferrugineus TaxID=354439 RepID=A0A834MI68_RHYFE|nr:hypothetical protein GWI33_021815 [Rhynchophorus ferrugineus]